MAADAFAQERPRARDIGLEVGSLPTGRRNAIIDVPGVKVGHVTRHSGDSIHTGMTAILPHGGNLYRDRVPAALFVGNGFGKLVGATQLRELGELETPILLTCTLCVWRAADVMAQWMIAKAGMESVRSINPVVGETNDGALNDIRKRAISDADVVRALESASSDNVDEGSIGAGAGTVAFGWKGGIGTSSRVVPAGGGEFTVGVIVQSNYGGSLTMHGAPVGRELAPSADRQGSADGSIMIIIATDAPLDTRNLGRLASRAMLALGRTGSSMSNGSGDYAIAFSTAASVRRVPGTPLRTVQALDNESMTPLFQGVVEAAEEAIYNSLLRATTVKGHRRTVEALPVEPLLRILDRHSARKTKD